MKNIKSKIVLLSALITFLFSACEKPISDIEGNSPAFCIPDSLLKNITYDTLKSESIISDLKLSGKITYDEDKVEKIFPLVSGHIEDVKVSLGDFVQKGQVLALVYSTEIANYFNDFKSAQSELAIAKKNLDVVADMNSSGVSSEKDLITAQNDYQKALASYNRMNTIMKIYGENVHAEDSSDSRYLIKAPISGFIVEKNINTGMELRPDDPNTMFTISDLREVWAVANVYETDIPKIGQGSAVEITTISYPDKVFKGKVERISNILNPETNSMTVKIRLNNADYTLKPGMFANISVLFPEKNKMLSVSAKSVLFDDSKNYVVLFRKSCDLSIQQVNVFKTFNNTDYIQSDSLHEGDVVIDRNSLFVFTALRKL